MKLKQHKVLILLLLACMTSLAGKSQFLTVWPGDANNNGRANHFDLLNVAMNLGLSGPARDSITTNWAPQQLLTPWSPGLGGFPNNGYADCDGSGNIDLNDVAVIQQNYGQVTGGFLGIDSSTLVLSGAPLLEANFALDSLSVNGLTTLAITISLGSPVLGVDSVLALAFTMDFDTTIVDSIIGFTLGSMFGFDSSNVSLFNVNRSLGIVEVAIVRTNRTNISGNGLLGTIVIALDDNIRVASNYNLLAGISKAAAYTANGSPVLLASVPDSIDIILPAKQPNSALEFVVYPNPAHSQLNFRSSHLTNATLKVIDLHGRVCHQSFSSTLNQYQIPLNSWPAGLYFLQVDAEEGKLCSKFVVVPDKK